MKSISKKTLFIALGYAAVWSTAATARDPIVRPDDAPPALSPEESLRRIRVPDGFQVELVASEPLIREPSGVCWDERGRLFVCELHGYNLEGQYDIEELNKTGELDRVVRRIQAPESAKRAAAAQTYGTVKLLSDTDGDGRMDKAEVWADRLPPCYGICPVRGGIIVACAPDIVFLADRDGDGRAEVREVLLTGFATGMLERGVNAPQWGPDNWIYFGSGHGGGRISGPNLPHPVDLPNTDFRIKSDGSAIEPVSGRTHTFGFAFTETGDRFVITTRAPLFVAPLPWRYLARNPDAAAPGLESSAITDQRVYPISRPHPWRTKRAEDPGFAKYYTDHYGIEESAPNGYFTSACSPLVYQDSALPGLNGNLLMCEPAQNLVHRAILERRGPQWFARRAEGEEQGEFLASSDAWFHPMALAHGPDGGVWIVDFYREIIEDYSAIPRYLQQLYGLDNGKDHGRIYRLVHNDLPAAPAADMTRLTSQRLVDEVASPYLWRRQTARRLLIERRQQQESEPIKRLVSDGNSPAVALNALATLEAFGPVDSLVLINAMKSSRAEVRVHALRLADRRFPDEPTLLAAALGLIDDAAPNVQLQLALSLGESHDPRTIPALARLARQHGDVPWLQDAVLSSLSGRAGLMLEQLMGDKPSDLGPARGILEPLCASIGARRDSQEISQALARIAKSRDAAVQAACLSGLRRQFKDTTNLALTDAAQSALKSLAMSQNADVRNAARALVIVLRVESAAERQARLDRATQQLANLQVSADLRVAAVAELGAENDPQVTSTLLAAFDAGTPQVREAILAAVFARNDRLPALITAIEDSHVTISALNAVQRLALMEHADPNIRRRAAQVIESLDTARDEDLARYVAALKEPRDIVRGERVFRDTCAKCHQAHGIGFAVGPDLTAEFQRAEETIIRDVLSPSAVIAPGYATYVIETIDGRVQFGLIAGESANSILLRQPEGKEQNLLRKEIEQLKASSVSIMPDDLAKTVSPQDLADCIAWLRHPPDRIVLFDDDPNFVNVLTEGEGTATLITTEKQHGQASLRVTPPQKFSAQIAGWSYRIRERPGPGEYRFLRFAWKGDGAHGVMIELADHGQWPPADAARGRYYAGQNTSGWKALEVAPQIPADWTIVTRDLWEDCGDCTLTGIAPTAMGGAALFDHIELLRHPP